MDWITILVGKQIDLNTIPNMNRSNESDSDADRDMTQTVFGVRPKQASYKSHKKRLLRALYTKKMMSS